MGRYTTHSNLYIFVQSTKRIDAKVSVGINDVYFGVAFVIVPIKYLPIKLLFTGQTIVIILKNHYRLIIIVISHYPL